MNLLTFEFQFIMQEAYFCWFLKHFDQTHVCLAEFDEYSVRKSLRGSRNKEENDGDDEEGEKGR